MLYVKELKPCKEEKANEPMNFRALRKYPDCDKRRTVDLGHTTKKNAQSK